MNRLKNNALFAAALSLVLLASCSRSAPERDTQGAAGESSSSTRIALFNGRDLTGWTPTGNARWTVEDGILVGQQGPDNAPGDLLTQASFSDFELDFTYRVEWPCNTGVWFRYQNAGKAYQADILEWPDPKCYAGTVYCPGKMFIAMNQDPTLIDRDGWNRMKVRAVGDHIQVWLNGTKVADVHDSSSDSGRIGIQVHPGAEFAPMKVMMKDMWLRPL